MKWYSISKENFWNCCFGTANMLHFGWTIGSTKGGTRPRFLDWGLVGRLDLETAKKKIGPLKKSGLNRLFYDFECRYKHNMYKRSLTSVKKREYNHIFQYFHDFTATVAGLLAPAFLGVAGPSCTEVEPSR